MSQAPTLPTPGRHIPILDGIRGLAIALVLFHHFFGRIAKESNVADHVVFGLAYRSWMGVDLFFVLSGFLITGILWDAKGREGYFRNFYVRRVLRIFPAYYCVLLVFFVVLPRVAGESLSHLVPPTADQVWHWTYLSNFRISYLGQWYPANIPNVFWSLAIEEQFYLVWPLIVLICGRRTLMIVCGVLFSVALILRLILAADPEVTWVSVFTLTPARMDSLVLGAFLALLFRSEFDVRKARLWAILVGVATLIPLTWLTLERPEGWREMPIQSLRFSLVAVFFGALLWLCVTGRQGSGILALLLCNGFMRMLGKYSYALYLWHGPVDEAIRHYYNPNSLAPVFGSKVPHALGFSCAAAVVSLLVAWLSWNLLEKHFLRMKRRFPVAPAAPAPNSAERAAT